MLHSVHSGNPDTTGTSKYTHSSSHTGVAMARSLLLTAIIAGLYGGLHPDTA